MSVSQQSSSEMYKKVYELVFKQVIDNIELFPEFYSNMCKFDFVIFESEWESWILDKLFSMH